MSQEEKLLIHKIIQSDDDAFRILFAKYQPVLFKFIYFKTSNYELSQDVVQEAFIKVWMNRGSLKPKLSFFSYLVTISNNLLKDYFKHLNVCAQQKDSIPAIYPSLNDNPEAALDFHILHEQIHAIVNTHFAETCRIIFFLSRTENKSNSEIADLLGIPKKKVENQLYTALKILRRKLKYLSNHA